MLSFFKTPIHEPLQFSFLFSVINVLCCKLFSYGSYWKWPWTRDDCCCDKWWMNLQSRASNGGIYTHRNVHSTLYHQALWLVFFTWLSRKMLEDVKQNLLHFLPSVEVFKYFVQLIFGPRNQRLVPYFLVLRQKEWKL
jgi:hypothetical protein